MNPDPRAVDAGVAPDWPYGLDARSAGPAPAPSSAQVAEMASQGTIVTEHGRVWWSR